MKITIFGTGYVGLTTGVCFADMGNDVCCVDIDETKLKKIKKGEVPFFEPSLEHLLKKNLSSNKIKFTNDPEEGINFADIIFIAVGTPPLKDGSADLQFVLSVAGEIGKYIKSYKVVVTKSTVPVGTSHKIADEINKCIDKYNSNKNEIHMFDIASNPEFLKEGEAVKDCMKPDRIIIGTSSTKALDILSRLYSPFNRKEERIIHMDVISAELTKYAANSMLATKISFMNEMSQISERLGADIELIRKGIGSDNRIGNSFIYPGAGFGGSCFPKDLKALTNTSIKLGYQPKILESVGLVNEEQKKSIFRKINFHFNNKIKGLSLALWGLSFKPGTDDIRESPSIILIQQLLGAGAEIHAYDPAAMENCSEIFSSKEEFFLEKDAYSTINNAEALIIMTEWKEFRTPDFSKIKRKLNQPVIFDGRNIYDPDYVADKGFIYYGVGRGVSIF